MKIEVNVTKTRFFVLLVVSLAILGVGVVYAYNSDYNDPSVFGHNGNELEGVCGTVVYNYIGDGVANRIIDLRDDYDEIHIYLNERASWDYNDIGQATASNPLVGYLVHAWAIGKTYGVTYKLLNTNSLALDDRTNLMSKANVFWQGKVVDTNEVKLGSVPGYPYQGTNEKGWHYKLVAKKYCNVKKPLVDQWT